MLEDNKRYRNTSDTFVTIEMLREYERYNTKLKLIGGFNEQSKTQQIQCQLKVNPKNNLVEDICVKRLQIYGDVFELPQFITQLSGILNVTIKSDTRKVKVIHHNNKIGDLTQIFAGVSDIDVLDLQEFDFTGIRVAQDLFYAQGFKTVIFGGSKYNKQFKPSDVTNMFYSCKYLEELDLTGIDFQQCKQFRTMFCDCEKLRSVKFDESTKFEEVPMGRDLGSMFNNCHDLVYTNIGKCKIPDADRQYYMFSDCVSIEEIDVSNIHGGYFAGLKKTFFWCRVSGMFKNCTSVKKIKLGEMFRYGVLDLDETFEDCENLEELDQINIVKSHGGISLNNAFQNCRSLKEIDLRGLRDTDLVQMKKAFYKCKELKKLRLYAQFGHTRNFRSAFSHCEKLEVLDIVDTIKKDEQSSNRISDINDCYGYCSKLKEITLMNMQMQSYDKTQQALFKCDSLEILRIPTVTLKEIVDDAKLGINSRYRQIYFEIYELNSNKKLKTLVLADNTYDLSKGSKASVIFEMIYKFKIDNYEWKD